MATAPRARLGLKSRVLRNTLFVSFVMFAVLSLPGTVRLALVASMLAAVLYAFAQIVFSRYCPSCGIAVTDVAWSKRPRLCSCGGSCAALWVADR